VRVAVRDALQHLVQVQLRAAGAGVSALPPRLRVGGLAAWRCLARQGAARWAGAAQGARCGQQVALPRAVSEHARQSSRQLKLPRLMRQALARSHVTQEPRVLARSRLA
jgi:hypothetical protein